MQMYDRPKFESCSAPICPLDANWELRSHLDGEKVCHYLTVLQKTPFKHVFCGGQQGELLQAIARQHPRIIALHSPIKRQLSRSCKNSERNELPAEMEV